MSAAVGGVELADADGYLVATIDDGKVNALSFELIDGVRAAIATASGRSRPLVITGRDGCFSAGFDLSVMNGGEAELAAALFSAGARLYRDLVEAPVPIVTSCTGHALAGGAILLLTRTTASGGTDPTGWVSTRSPSGWRCPRLPSPSARYRLEPRFLTQAALFSEVASPERHWRWDFSTSLPRIRWRQPACWQQRWPRSRFAAFATTRRRRWRGLQQELAALEGPL